ncbi:MAG: hypothetical protein V4721_10450 [Bacteroidota bacterium]
MIYAIPNDNYPKTDQFTEEIIYKDENDFEWRIARIVNGFIVKYFGDVYFSPTTFECELKTGKTVRIKNTLCIFFKETDFDTFYHVREVIKKGYTDDIWDTFEELFTDRLNENKDVLESEVIDF